MTGPRIGLHDEFEGIYKEKFRSLARPYGEFVEYERDRAAIDVGLHLTEVADDKVREKFQERFEDRHAHAGLVPTQRDDSRGDKAALSYGALYYTYEFVLQMTTEFGYDHVSFEGVIEDDYRIEGDVISAQGPCAVLIHSDKFSCPDMDVKALAQELVDTKGIRRLLVFTNDKPEPAYFGSFFGAVRDTGLRCEPQFLGDLAFNLLIATTVYMEFRDRLSWEHVSYLHEALPGESV